MKKNKIILIGAGISNLTAANYLLDNSFDDFVILEKGELLLNRKCNGAEKYTCYHCLSGCAITEGVGGANALNGNKLCYFPSSCNIFNQTENHIVENAFSYIQKNISNIVEPSFNKENRESTEKKNYISDVLDKNKFREMINLFTNRINSHIITNSDVISISLKEKEIHINTSNGNHYICDFVLIGTGRSSYHYLKEDFFKNNFLYKEQKQDIGIRIETHKNNFSKNYYYQADPKFRFSFDNLGSGRTFCAVNKGEVIPVKFGNSFYAEGSFGDSFGDKNNIALMARSNNHLNLEQIEDWCQRINELSNNQLIIGDIAISNNRELMISEILELIKYFPTNTHKKLIQHLLHKIFIGKFNILNFDVNSESLRIYAPAIDRYWIQPILNKDFSIRGSNNVFIVGDAAGLSRGYIQAMYSGYKWAITFLKNSPTIKQREGSHALLI